MRVRTALGRFGEDTAVRHLEDSGLVILERNWRCSAGEIDIIARDGPVIVFVEVMIFVNAVQFMGASTGVH